MKTRLLLTICFTVITICLPNCKHISVEPPRVQIVQPQSAPYVQVGDKVNVHLIMTSSLPMDKISLIWVYGVNKVPCSPKTFYELNGNVAIEKELSVIVPSIAADIVEEHDVFLEIEVFTEESSKKEFLQVNYATREAINGFVFSVSDSGSEVVLRVCSEGKDQVIFKKFNTAIVDAVFYHDVALLHISEGLMPVDTAGNVLTFASEPTTALLGVKMLDKPYLLYSEHITSVNSKMERIQSFSLPINTKPYTLVESEGVLFVLSNELAGSVSLTKLNVRSGLVLDHQVIKGRAFSAVIADGTDAFLLFEKSSNGTVLVRFSSQNSMNTLLTISHDVVEAFTTSSGSYILTDQDELYAFDVATRSVQQLVTNNIASISTNPNQDALIVLQKGGLVYRVTSTQLEQIAETCTTKDVDFVGVN